MGIHLEDGAGYGYVAKVTDEHQLHVRAESHSLQFHNSAHHGNAYQVIGDFASLNNSTHTLIHLENTHGTKSFAVTYMRIELVGTSGGSALPAAATYFQIGTGSTYTSGGTAVTPVNLNSVSGKSANVAAYDNDPTVGGTFEEIDRWYPDGNGKMMSFNKEGSVIIGPSSTLEIRVVTDVTAGTGYARVSFVEQIEI